MVVTGPEVHGCFSTEAETTNGENPREVRLLCQTPVEPSSMLTRLKGATCGALALTRIPSLVTMGLHLLALVASNSAATAEAATPFRSDETHDKETLLPARACS